MKTLAFILCIFSATPSIAQQDPLVLCLKQLSSDSRFTPIADKIAITSAPDTTFAMLAETSVANDSERLAISAWATARKECVRDGEAYWTKTYPLQIFALANESENAVLAVAVDLYNKSISFGEFNKRRQAIADVARTKIAAVVQQIVAEREVKQQALQQARDAQATAQQRDQAARQEAQRQFDQAQEAQDIAMRRSAAMQMFLNNMRPTQPYQLPMPQQPINTNCYRIGNQVNCTTR